MTEAEIDLVPPRNMADGKPPRVRVRTGDTVHRTSYAWSPAVLDLLQHVEREGFEGAPRALGFDDQGREVLAFIDGEVARGTEFIRTKAAGSTFSSRTSSGATRCSSISAHCFAATTTQRRRSRGLVARGVTK